MHINVLLSTHNSLLKVILATESTLTRHENTLQMSWIFPQSQRFTVQQGQKFVAVLKAKNRGAATSQNVKNRGIVAAKIVKNRGDIAAKIVKIVALSRPIS